MSVPHVFVISTTTAALERAAIVLSGESTVRHGGEARRQAAHDVRTFASVQSARREIHLRPPDAAVLLLRDTTPEQCLQACVELQAALSPLGIPLAVIFPSTDPGVWQLIYASGANMFLPWHGEVIEGLPVYVDSLLRHWGRSRPAAEARGPALTLPRSPLGGIVLDARRRCADIRDWHAQFTPVQFRILRYLVHNKGRLVSKAELAEVLMELHGRQSAHPATSLYQHISQIRKKLGPHAGIVRCIRSRGYMLDTSFLAA